MLNNKQKVLARNVTFLHIRDFEDFEDFYFQLPKSEIKVVLKESIDFYDKNEDPFFADVKKVLIIISDRYVRSFENCFPKDWDVLSIKTRDAFGPTLEKFIDY